jgi:hypothetical protein
MLENNWKTWIVLLVAFVGASFELLKHLPSSQTVTWEKENLHYGMEGKPYSIHELPKKLRAPSRPAAAHVAGDDKVLAEALKSYKASVAQTQTEIAHKEAPAKKAAAKKKKKSDDEYEEVIDPVTGKKVKRKKKKTAKKEEEKPKEPVAASDSKPASDTQDQPEANDAQAIAAAIAESARTGELPLPIKKSSVDAFASLQEWERVLLNRPDLAETKAFIQAFKNHTVSTDIYYKITKMMIADSRSEMKSLGVLCAGSNPSVMSFQVLASVSTSGTADIKANAQKYIDTYSNSISNLQILLGVLRGTDTAAATLALKEFDQAANKFLASGSTSQPGTQNNHSANAARFEPFRSVLTQLASSGSGSLASQARQSLQNLETLLGPSTTTNLAQTP